MYLNRLKTIIKKGKKMELTLERRWPKADYTIGVFCIDGKRYSESLEDTDRGLTADMPISKIKRIKVYGKTAIPKGRYKVDMHTVSPRFKNRIWAKKYGGIVPRLVGVPCYSGVCMHPFNYADQSLGCIATGENKVKGGLVKAAEYHMRLMEEYLIPADVRGEEIYITIK